MQHCSGLRHGNADGLSRQYDDVPPVCAVSFGDDESFSLIRDAVHQDPELSVVIDRLRRNQLSSPGDSDFVRTLLGQNACSLKMISYFAVLCLSVN